MQEIQILRWCDMCDGREPGDEREFSHDGKAWTVDLCKTHYDDTLGVLTRVAVVATAADSINPAATPCPVCSKRVGSISQHVNERHPGITPEGWLSCDICGRVAQNRHGMHMHYMRAGHGGDRTPARADA